MPGSRLYQWLRPGCKDGFREGTCSHGPLCALPTDVDECVGDAHLCQEGQRCVNLLGTYTCLPDCRPGFRVTADGKGCEGDRDTRQGLVILPEPRECRWDSEHLERSWQKPRAGVLSFLFLTPAHLWLTKEGVSHFL